METAKVSVIIPVYNTELYLDQCLDSVVRQTLREIEIICVNDGSVDGSADILQRYAAQDDRIRVVSQENCGLAGARNNGMKEATGEYLAFLDSDDWFDLKALEKMYAQAARDEADICVCGRTDHLDYYGGSISFQRLPNRKHYPQNRVFNLQNNPDWILNFTSVIVNGKLFRRSFLEKYEISFIPVKRGEDVNFSVIAFCTADRITVISESLVHYRVFRPESLTSTLGENPEEYVDIWLKTAEELRRRGICPERSMVNLALDSLLWVIQRAEWPEYKRLYNRIKTEVFPKLGIQPCENGWYVPWQETLLEHMYRESAEEFLLSFLRVMDIRIREARAQGQAQAKNDRKKLKQQKKKLEDQAAQIDTAKNEIRKLKASGSYRIGRAVTFIPRKVKSVFVGSRPGSRTRSRNNGDRFSRGKRGASR